MRRVGEVVRTAQGVLVARSVDDAHPAVGEVLVDESLADVGRVLEVFGPVDRPYLAMDPVTDDRLATHLGTVVYAR